MAEKPMTDEQRKFLKGYLCDTGPVQELWREISYQTAEVDRLRKSLKLSHTRAELLSKHKARLEEEVERLRESSSVVAPMAICRSCGRKCRTLWCPDCKRGVNVSAT